MDKILIVLRKEFEKTESEFKCSLFETEFCYDVICALQKVRNEKPKLVIIDMATSRISGMDLVKIIRSNPYNYHMKISVTSRNFNYKFLKETFESGADFYLKYPFTIADIEKIYMSIKMIDRYIDMDEIARRNEFHWLAEI
jgi:CheY-like chemotaxis protein